MLGIWKSSIQALVLGVILPICMDLASGIKIEVIPPKPKDGDNIVLKVTEISGMIRFATWYKGQSTDAKDQILNFYPPSTQYNGSKYVAEARGQPNGSLVINNVRTEFNGYYTVQIQTTSSLQQGSVQLSVNGVISIALSPIALLLSMLLLTDIDFL